jgi:hypothetical protein
VSRRTTLRPVDADPPAANEPAPPSPPAPSQPSAVAEWSVSRSALLGAGLVVTAIVIVGALMLLGVQSSSPASSPVAAPAATATTCPSVTSFLDVIASYERQAHWGLAATTTQTALRMPGMCEPDRAALGQKLVALSREALFEQPPAPEDAPGQRRVVAAYTDLKTTATQYAVPPPPPLPIAQSAYDNRLFLLATVAYADAFINGDSSKQDRDVVRADYAAQYNLGLIWSKRTDSSQRQDGLARLATACRISERNQLGSPEACNELQAVLGARIRWPAPLGDPLIQ